MGQELRKEDPELKLAYDSEAHGLFIMFSDGASARSEDVGAGMVADFDSSGTIVALEIEDVRGLIDEDILDRMTRPRIESGADLRRYRESLSMTQEQLGEILDVPRNTLARWERGELVIEKSRMLELALYALVSAPSVQAKTHQLRAVKKRGSKKKRPKKHLARRTRSEKQ